PQVDHGHVGLLRQQAQAFVGRRRRAGELQVFVQGGHCGHALMDQGMIVDDDHADPLLAHQAAASTPFTIPARFPAARALSAAAIRQATTVPRPGRLHRRSRPPAFRATAAMLARPRPAATGCSPCGRPRPSSATSSVHPPRWADSRIWMAEQPLWTRALPTASCSTRQRARDTWAFAASTSPGTRQVTLTPWTWAMSAAYRRTDSENAGTASCWGTRP